MSVADSIPSGPVSLKWHQFSNNLGITSNMLRDSNILTDTTLVVEGIQVPAHRFILAASSSLFLSLLHPISHPHPLVYLRGVSHRDLMFLLDFMYKGVVHVEENYLLSFLKTAEELKVKGLSEGDETEKNDSESENVNNEAKAQSKVDDESSVNEIQRFECSEKVIDRNESMLVKDLHLGEDSSEMNSSASFSGINVPSKMNSRIRLSEQKLFSGAELNGDSKQVNISKVNDPPSLSARRLSLYGKALTEEWRSQKRNAGGEKMLYLDNHDQIKHQRRKRKSGGNTLSSSSMKLSKNDEGIPGVTDQQKAVSASLEAAIESTKQEIRNLEVEKDAESSFVSDTTTDGTIAEVEKVLKLSQEVLGGLNSVERPEEGAVALDTLDASKDSDLVVDSQFNLSDTQLGIVLSPEQKKAMIEIMLIKSELSSTPWKCSTCRKVFKSKSAAVKHIQKKHVDVEGHS